MLRKTEYNGPMDKKSILWEFIGNSLGTAASYFVASLVIFICTLVIAAVKFFNSL